MRSVVTVISNNSMSTHHAYITGALGNSENYFNLYSLLFGMEEDDDLNLHINISGGELSDAVMLINAIKGCQGIVHGHIQYECDAIGAFIFLACDEWSWSDHVKVELHGVAFIEDFAERQRHQAMYRDYCGGFLNDDEIEYVLFEGKNLILYSDDIDERTDAFIEKMKPLLTVTDDSLMG
jgi:ATP-dependent protease ClpP protease subunit